MLSETLIEWHHFDFVVLFVILSYCLTLFCKIAVLKNLRKYPGSVVSFSLTKNALFFLENFPNILDQVFRKCPRVAASRIYIRNFFSRDWLFRSVLKNNCNE